MRVWVCWLSEYLFVPINLLTASRAHTHAYTCTRGRKKRVDFHRTTCASDVCNYMDINHIVYAHFGSIQCPVTVVDVVVLGKGGCSVLLGNIDFGHTRTHTRLCQTTSVRSNRTATRQSNGAIRLLSLFQEITKFCVTAKIYVWITVAAKDVACKSIGVIVASHMCRTGKLPWSLFVWN